MASHFYDDVMAALQEGIENYGSAAALCAAAGVNAANVSRWMNDKHKPSLPEIGQLMDVLGVSIQKSGLNTAGYILLTRLTPRREPGPVGKREQRSSAIMPSAVSFLSASAYPTKTP